MKAVLCHRLLLSSIQKRVAVYPPMSHGGEGVNGPSPGPGHLGMNEVTLGKALPGKSRTEPQVAVSFLKREAEGERLSPPARHARAVPHPHAFPWAVRSLYFRTDVK